MTFRKWNFVFLVLTYFIVSSCFAKNKPQSDVSDSAMYTSDKPRQPMDQTFNINNWGFGSADRKTLMQIKSKIDSLYEPKSTPTGKSFTFTIFENYRLDIKRVADITRLNEIILREICSSFSLSSRWLGPLRKLRLPHHQHSNPKMERCSTNMSDAWRRPRYNKISR